MKQYPQHQPWVNEVFEAQSYFAIRRAKNDPAAREAEMSRWLAAAQTSLTVDAFAFLQRQVERFRVAARIQEGQLSAQQAEDEFRRVVDAGFNSLDDEINFVFLFVGGPRSLVGAVAAAKALMPAAQATLTADAYADLVAALRDADENQAHQPGR